MNEVIQRADDIRTSLHVIPSALVAWADGRVDAAERAVLERIVESARGAANRAEPISQPRWLEQSTSSPRPGEN